MVLVSSDILTREAMGLRRSCLGIVLAIVVAVTCFVGGPVSAGQEDSTRPISGEAPHSSHDDDQTRAGCSRSTRAVAGLFKWAESTACRSTMGAKGTKITYAWQIAPLSNGRICVEAYGFVKKKGKFKGKWFSAGCGTGGQVTVPWGAILSFTKVRAKLQPGFLGGAYKWWY